MEPRIGGGGETSVRGTGYSFEAECLPTSPRGIQLADDLRGLIGRSAAGEQLAIKQLIELYSGQVFGLCYRMLGHRQDAEDVAQETFVRAIRGLGGWDRARDFEPWLLAIAGNRCRTLLAKRLRRPPTVTYEDVEGDGSEELQAASQLAEEISRALGHIREEYRQAFLLFHEQEMSYAEIGQVLDCPLGTVKTWVYRARRELVDQLRERGVVQEGRACSAKALNND